MMNKKLILLLSLATFVTLINAQEIIPYSTNYNSYDSENDFQSDWKYLNSSPGVWIFDNTSYFGIGPSNAPVYYSSSTTAADDWLISPAFSLNAGVNYNLSFLYSQVITGYQDKMTVYVGTDNTAASMTSLITDLSDISVNSFTTQNNSFTVPSNGNYYIGFHATSNAGGGGIAIDNFNIDVISGVDNYNNYTISIFPNPTNGKLSIVNLTKANISVYNSIGKLILERKNVSNKDIINLANFNNGIYFVKITEKNTTLTKRILLNN